MIAEASSHDGAVACQANREWCIKVRQHAGPVGQVHVDGRAIVYGWRKAGMRGIPAGERELFVGYLLDNADESDVIRAIRRVAGSIGDDALGSECIANLPARPLD